MTDLDPVKYGRTRLLWHDTGIGRAPHGLIRLVAWCTCCRQEAVRRLRSMGT